MMQNKKLGRKVGEKNVGWVRVWDRMKASQKTGWLFKGWRIVGIGMTVWLLGITFWVGWQSKQIIGDLDALKKRMMAVEERLRDLIMTGDGIVIEAGKDEVVSETAEAVADEIKQQVADEVEVPEIQVPVIIQQPTSSGVREFFVPIGGGSTRSRSWMDINGAQVTVDHDRYGNIKEVYFEASLHVVSGNVYARLENVTDEAIYHDAVVVHNTSTPTWKTSSSIGLAGGNKTYRVQMKSDSGELGIMDQARLRILVE